MGWKEDLKRNLGTSKDKETAQPIPAWKQNLKDNLKEITTKPITPPALTPIVQTDPLTNARNLFTGKGFQVLNKTVYPTPKPLGESRYNPFSSLEMPKVDTGISASTPMIDLNAQGPLETVFGATRAATDLATLPLTIPFAALDKKSTVKDVISATMDMAKADVQSGGIASMDKAAADYFKMRKVGKYGGEKIKPIDIAVATSLGFFHIFGDPMLAAAEIKGIRQGVKFMTQFKKTGSITKTLPEGSLFSSKGKATIDLNKDLKLVINKSKNEVKLTGYVRRGSQGEIVKQADEIKVIADNVADATGLKVTPKISGNDLILQASKPTGQGINLTREAAAIKPAEEGLVFGGQEQISKTPAMIESDVPALDFNAPAMVDEVPAVERQIVEPFEADPKNFKTAEDYVKAQGKTVYHGTSADFKEFDISKSGDVTQSDWGKGIYFTDKKDVAKSFADDAVGELGGKPKIIEATLDLKNPARNADLIEPDIQNAVDDMMGFTDMGEVLKKKGFDGIEFTHTDGSIEYVVFDPKQIKTKSQLISEWNKANKIADSKAIKQTTKTETLGVKADKGEYAEEVKGKGKTEFKTMETPEQYRLAKEIMPDLNFIMKNSKKFNGYFRPAKGQEVIAMNRQLYKRAKDETKEAYQTRIGKTMAHEIGHLIDYLPEGEMNRGNLLGRLQVVSNFKQNFIAEDEVLKQRQKLMRKINEINKNDELLDSQQEKLTKPLLDELAKLNKSITFNNPVFKDELVKLSRMWKPWEDGIDATYDAYRKSAAELYADFNSVLFNDPALAQEIAPRFYNEFFNSLNKKPEVEKAFLGIQAELIGDKASLMGKRWKMLKESGQNAQGRFASMVAERDALRKKPWLNAILKEAWYQHYWAAKKGKPVENLMEIMDRGFNNELYIWTEKNIKPIMDNLGKAGLDANDMDAILTLERIAKDLTRTDVANIKGLDVKTAEDVLEELENVVGAEKAKVLVDEAKNLRASLKELQLKHPDLWTPEQKASMESNDFYAPFNVLFNESNNIGYYIKQSTGNIDKDFSPFVNTLLRAKAVSHFGAKNDIKKNVIDNFLENADKDLKKADVSYTKMANGQLQRNVKKPSQGWGQVDIKREGKIESYYLPEDIAHSLNQDNLGTLSSIMKPFNVMTKPFKQFYTGIINPGFQVVNFLFRDWGTSSMFFGPEWNRAQQGKSNAGLNIIANNTYRNLFSKLNQAKWYYRAFKNIKDKNVHRKYSPIVEEGLKNHVIEVDAQGLYKLDAKTLSEQDKAGVKYILETIGLVEKGKGLKEFSRKAQAIAQTFEETPKLAAYMYMQKMGVLTDDNLSVIRNYVGSPNFWKQGRENKNISSLMMFYNPIIRGLENLGVKAFKSGAAGKGSRNAFWWRVARTAIIPALIGVAAEEGFFGDDLKKQHNLLPEYLKSNYISIPIGTDENGKVKTISVPLDEDARMIHSLTRNMARIALHSSDKSIRTRALVDILAYTGGQVPGTTPAITIAETWSTTMSGGNPYDSFRRQHLFLANEEKYPMSEKLKIVAKWTFNQNGILKVDVRDSIESRTISEQVISSTPVLNRFLRTTNRGEYEADREVVKEESEAAAMKLMEKKKEVNDIVEAVNKDHKYDIQSDIVELAKERLGAEANDPAALNKEVKTLISAVQEEYTTNFGSVHYRSLINQSNDVKEKVLVSIYERGSMNKKEFASFLQEAMSIKIISPDVVGKVLITTGLGSIK